MLSLSTRNPKFHRCKLETAQHKQLGSEEKQLDISNEDGGFFSGFLPDFDTLTGFLSDSDEEEPGGTDDEFLLKNEDESTGELNKNEPLLLSTIDNLNPESNQLDSVFEDEKIDEGKENIDADYTEDFEEILENDNVSNLENNQEPTEADLTIVSEADEAGTDFLAMGDSDTDPEIVQTSLPDGDDKMESVDELLAENKEISEQYDTDLHAISEESDSQVHEEEQENENSDFTMEISEEGSKDGIKLETSNEVNDIAISENNEIEEFAQEKDSPPTVPGDKNSPPTRGSDHPILQEITREINQNNRKSRLFSLETKHIEEKGDNEVASSGSDDNLSESIDEVSSVSDDENVEKEADIEKEADGKKETDGEKGSDVSPKDSQPESMIAKDSDPSDLEDDLLQKDVESGAEPDLNQAETKSEEPQAAVKSQVIEVDENSEQELKDDNIEFDSEAGHGFGMSSEELPDSSKEMVEDEIVRGAPSASEEDVDEETMDNYNTGDSDTGAVAADYG